MQSNQQTVNSIFQWTGQIVNNWIFLQNHFSVTISKHKDKVAYRKEVTVMENKNNVKSIVMVGFFAAITFLGIQAFRIPLPAAIGTPFLHFGHVFVVMGVLLLGGKKGAIAGTMGLVIFDMLNGYMHSVPDTLFGTIFKCLIMGALFANLKTKADGDKHKEYTAAVLSAITYGAINVVIELISGTVLLLVAGSNFNAAIIGSITSVPATVINAIFMIVIVSLIYVPVKSIYMKIAAVPA